MAGDALTPPPFAQALALKGGFCTGDWFRFFDNVFRRMPRGGTFTLANAPSTTVNDPNVLNSTVVLLMPANATAASLVGSTWSPYISSRVSGANGGFTVTTQNGLPAQGNEVFDYILVRR